MRILYVYDNEGNTFDRYTIIFKRGRNDILYKCLALSFNCDSPQGFSQWDTISYDYFPFNLIGFPLFDSYLGKQIRFDDLPLNVKKHIKERIE